MEDSAGVLGYGEFSVLMPSLKFVVRACHAQTYEAGVRMQRSGEGKSNVWLSWCAFGKFLQGKRGVSSLLPCASGRQRRKRRKCMQEST